MSRSLTEFILVFLVLSDLALLGSSRFTFLIRIVAVQGVLLGAMPLLAGTPDFGAHAWILAAGIFLLKGVLFPWLLFRARREANVSREVEPLVGFSLSLVCGVFALAFSLWIGVRLPLPAAASHLVPPVALFTLLSGLFLIVARKKALTQVIGYLTMENGIYAFGVTMAHREPLLVELGVMLDVFAAVFVMGIAIFHINREFDHIDTYRLSQLSEWRNGDKAGKKKAPRDLDTP